MTLGSGVRATGRRSRHFGSAAIEVLLILVVFILPFLMLLVNMSYNGVRTRHAQSALRLGAFQYAEGLMTKESEASRDAATASVSQAFFQGETDPVTLTVLDTPTGSLDGVPDTRSILSGASSRKQVDISVTRNPPHANGFPRSPLRGMLIFATNTWTYCELKDDESPAASAVNAIRWVGSSGLWLFGGCGGGSREGCAADLCGQ